MGCKILLAGWALIHNLLGVASCVLGLQACTAVSGPCWPGICTPASPRICYHHIWHNLVLPSSCVSIKQFSVLPVHDSHLEFLFRNLTSQ